ncbi:MAG: ribonuclease J [Thermomicrobiales bacterium]|nr:ribonuclease J [Thermomicrobiales bacterium]
MDNDNKQQQSEPKELSNTQKRNKRYWQRRKKSKSTGQNQETPNQTQQTQQPKEQPAQQQPRQQKQQNYRPAQEKKSATTENQQQKRQQNQPRVRRPRREEETSPRQPRFRHAAPPGGFATAGPIGSDTLRVIPLGGVGEVGKNMTVVECGNDIVMLDAGGKFPEESQRGIDLIIPDVTFVVDRLRNFRGILITHGHEDHIGGLPYIVPQLVRGDKKVPIYATPLAIGFIQRKLEEARLDNMVELHTVKGGDTVQLGQIKAEYIHVTHSIPDACAIALHTSVGTIVDTGDFKFDPTPVMGKPTDEKRLKRLGDRGVLALFSDTVRVEVDGSTPSESVVLKNMDEEIKSAKGQVIIATFASNISRIHMAMLAAKKYGRKVAVAGRSMEQNSRVAQELGYLDDEDDLLIPLDAINRMPKDKRVIVVTGSQGEASAALSRIAAGEHPKIRVSRGDKIIVSATPIPGNEDTVSHTINNLFKLGTDVVYSGRNRAVHVSGHAGRDELAKMIQLLRPKYAVPIHGEYRHMALYREICVENGIRREHVMLPEIGGIIEFTRKDAGQRGRVPSGNILVDRLGDRGNPQTVLRTRENLTENGFVVVTLIMDRATSELVAGPYLVGQGLAPEISSAALKEAENEVRRLFARRDNQSPQYAFIVQRTKETVGRVLYRHSKTRPLVLPIVTEL